MRDQWKQRLLGRRTLPVLWAIASLLAAGELSWWALRHFAKLG